MFLPIVLSLAASTFALPMLELPDPPKVVVVVTSETELERLQLNTERPLMNSNEHIEVVESHLINSEKKEQIRRLYEDEKRIIEEGKRKIDEEKRMIEEKKIIDEGTSKIMEEEKRIIEEEKTIIEKEENKLIKDEKTIMREEQERKIILPALPRPPELPPVDESILTTFLKAKKLQDSQDVSKDVKPYIFMSQLPRIIFPGRYLIDNFYGPHITLGV